MLLYRILSIALAFVAAAHAMPLTNMEDLNSWVSSMKATVEDSLLNATSEWTFYNTSRTSVGGINLTYPGDFASTPQSPYEATRESLGIMNHVQNSIDGIYDATWRP